LTATGFVWIPLMRRYPSSPGTSFSFGPGPLTPIVKLLLIVNAVAFVFTLAVPGITMYLGFRPFAIVQQLWIWQPFTYMFLHGGLFHLLFNMLALWMFGVTLERTWGPQFFLKYYFVTGLGAAATTFILSLLPFGFSAHMYYSVTIGASGAIYGLLLAFAMYFPNRPIYMYFLFPVPAKYFVMIIGAIALLLSISDTRGGVAHVAHLGGLVVGYLYLRGGGGRLTAEIKYRYLKWKMNRLRRKFDVYSGGKKDVDRRLH
jgi:membrane associated rhomboid family serine protease